MKKYLSSLPPHISAYIGRIVHASAFSELSRSSSAHMRFIILRADARVRIGTGRGPLGERARVHGRAFNWIFMLF